MSTEQPARSSAGGVLGVIPARGGSKGLPRKNIRPLLDRPLIDYIIGTAHTARLLDRVIVSTDDDEIAAIAKECGAEVPFRRPDELGGDAVPWVPVLQHAVRMMEEEHAFPVSAVVTLQPTTPLLDADCIDECIQIFLDTGCDVVTVCQDTRNYKIWRREEDGSYSPHFDLRRPNRQWVQHDYREDGYVYVSSRATLMEHDRLTGDGTRVVVRDDDLAIDMHDEVDFVIAEALLKHFGRA
ncbi:MAG: hypothetical protein AUJ92_19850 [Armatimonadetes bacterium CG2_30_59_28]|nr:acylneuraminate cytidylyltransferase family protein [Armatimonadota bacterium]OIO90066.1 MAG: hypothetical protein AUJ92_19850 [Armatimonadetes bacterium CG2_30_59_28]PIU60529.1 MAG: hypothetical protein COS85_24150 [Armatimonadetes bacterium CG07_land_8_20_14_0_80_59_28]PIX43236.1 MAG: hypothetical protein COZ56_07550 [Armatimonadetes bacterium CG_4_8_14_3_um_filter_58_9]PIY43141.1 MAG: hypothetical protein COZ05_11970 [Armatimonadetes bacterium CG_4_10_14_3_um_filter_59_10]PJB62352.1 MAG: